MTLAISLAWAGLVAGMVLRGRPVGAARVDALVMAGAQPGHFGVSSPGRARPVVPLPSRRALVAGAPVVALSAVLFPPLALLLLGVAAVRPHVRRRREAIRFRRRVERNVGDVVTLISLAVNSGHNLLGAVRAAAAHGDGPLAAALRSAAAAVERGARLADALEALPDELGEVVRPVAVALVSCDRYGAPLGPTLERLAADVRIAARQQAEAAARRLPIRLLFPLVSCILPAFGLLTVAPLIAGSLRGLSL